MFTLLMTLAALYGAYKGIDKGTEGNVKNNARDLAQQLKNENPELLDNMSEDALSQFITDNYSDQKWWGKHTLDTASVKQDLLQALNAYNNIPIFEGQVPDRDEVFAEAAADLEADREAYTQGINQNLSTIQQNYNNYRNSILGQQHMNRNLVMDNMQSQMRQSQQNAIEAGASAGVRLANNVNVLLSNQNSLRQSSIDTANNLSQTLMSQQAQALSQREKLLGYNADYNQRLHNTQMSRLNDAQNAYGYDRQAWQQKVSDATTGLGSNPFASQIQASAVKRNQSYGQRR